MKSKKKRNQEIRSSEKDYKKYNHQLQKPKKTRRLQKKNEYEFNKRKTFIRKQIESYREVKQNERRQK